MEFDFWEHEKGQSRAKNFIMEQDRTTSGKIFTYIVDLQKYPINALLRTGKVVKLKLSNFDLYEIKYDYKKVYYRFLFVLRNNIGYILEAFKKKSNDTPSRYIETAKQRSKALDYQFNQPTIQ